jgi:hypothetical protein
MTSRSALLRIPRSPRSGLEPGVRSFVDQFTGTNVNRHQARGCPLERAMDSVKQSDEPASVEDFGAQLAKLRRARKVS